MIEVTSSTIYRHFGSFIKYILDIFYKMAGGGRNDLLKKWIERMMEQQASVCIQIF